MNNNITFSFNRVGLLLQRFLVENKSNEMRTFLVSIICFFLLRDISFFFIYLFVVGVSLGTRFFNNFNKPTNTMQYLLIPATTLEKIVSAFILNTCYFFILTMLAYFVGNGLAYLVAISGILPDFLSINPDACFQLLHLTGSRILNLFIGFATLQAVFTFGVIYFKGNNTFLKTIIALFVVGIIFSIIGGIILKLTFNQTFISGDMITINSFSDYPALNVLKNIVSVSAYLIAPFFWVVSYFRLTEKEV